MTTSEKQFRKHKRKSIRVISLKNCAVLIESGELLTTLGEIFDRVPKQRNKGFGEREFGDRLSHDLFKRWLDGEEEDGRRLERAIS